MSNASIFPPNRNSNWTRFFPFERRSWKKIIADSGLPEEAKKLIQRVVKRSRLMRFEKIEVIQELIGHFQDGLSAGNDYPYLIANFGDPDVTAKLVRRSKIRNRPIMLRVLQIFGWMILGIFSAYFMVYAYFHSASPTPSTDYLAVFNQRQNEVDESEKAWPIYRPLWIKYGFSEGGEFANSIEQFIYHNNEDGQPERLTRPGDPEWPTTVAKLEETADLLDAFRKGARKPRLGLELQADVTKYSPEDFQALFPRMDAEKLNEYRQWSKNSEVNAIMKDAVINVRMPHIQQFRTAARIFIVDTRWAVEQNDSKRAVENFETFVGLASQAADTNNLIGSLIGFAVAGIGFGELEETLLQHPDFFDAEQLAQLQNSIGSMSFTEMTRFEGEKAYQLDLVQRAFSDNGNGDGRITPLGVKVFTTGLMTVHNQMLQETGDEENDRVLQFAEKAAAPAALFFVASRKETEDKMIEYTDLYAQVLHQPFWEREEPDLEEFLQGNKIKHAFMGTIIPAFDSVIAASDRMNARQQGVLTGLAAQRYFLANGKWPTDVIDLVPDYLSKPSIDMINGQNLNLTIDEHGPIIYSVGLDRVDDGGIQSTRKNGSLLPASSNHTNTNELTGDWILWPQSRFDEQGFRAADDAQSTKDAD